MRDKLLFIATFIAVVVFFHDSYGLRLLLPQNISWIMTYLTDWGTHYLGWYFFRNEDWHFPLGHIANYFYPVGTNVGYTDSIPLLAIFFKLLSPVLPEDFQYFGMWLLLCHLLAAYFTLRVCKLLNVGTLYSFVAAVLVTTNPVLFFRGIHPALCAHWLLIACVYVYLLNPASVGVARILGYQAILLVLSALITPYLCVMVLGCIFFTALKLSFFDKVLPVKHFFGYVGLMVFGLLAVWYASGMITFGKKEDLASAGQYGFHGLDLNALYNGNGYSALLSQPGLVRGYHEGYMYLGVGVLVLLFAALAYLVYQRATAGSQQGTGQLRAYFNNVHLGPLATLAVLYTLFAVTHIVSLNQAVLFQVPVPGPLLQLGNVFRASARFFWLPYYLLFLFAVVIIAKSRLKPAFKASLVVAALLVQLYDVRPMLTDRQLGVYGSYTPPIDPKWRELIKQFDEIVFYPPFQYTYLTTSDYQYFCYYAARERKRINIGYLARADNNAVVQMSDSLTNELVEDRVSTRKLFITTPPHLKSFFYVLQAGAARLNTLDGYYYLFGTSVRNPVVLNISNAVNAGKREKLDSIRTAAGTGMALFKEAGKITIPQDDSIRYNLDLFNDQEKYITVNGWAFVSSTTNNQDDSVFLFLNGTDKSYLIPAEPQPRSDVADFFKNPGIANAGFRSFGLKQGVARGNYTLGIAIKGKQNQWTYQPTDRTIKVGTEYARVTAGPDTIPAGDISWNLDQWETDGQSIRAAGWAFSNNQGTEDALIQLVLQNGSRTYLCETNPVRRPDVAAHFKQEGLGQSGFDAKVAKSALPKGTYRVGIYIRNRKTQAAGMVLTNKNISI